MDPSTISSGGFPDLGLDGAVIVVTGAGSGIGAATALRLGAAGAHVVLVGRRIEPLELSARAVQDAGGEVIGVATVVDRATGAAEAIEAEGFAYRSVLGLADLGLV